MLGKQALGDGLVEKQQVRIARLQRIEIEPRDHAAVGMQLGRVGTMTEREKRLDRAMLLQQFERARLDADRARIRRGRSEPIDDAHRHAGRARLIAAARPVGPAPTISTGGISGSVSAMRTSMTRDPASLRRSA